MRVAPGDHIFIDPRCLSGPDTNAVRATAARGSLNTRAGCLKLPGPRSVRGSYSGWNSARMLPSGSLNHADLPTPVVVATWLTVLRVSKS